MVSSSYFKTDKSFQIYLEQSNLVDSNSYSTNSEFWQICLTFLVGSNNYSMNTSADT